MMSFFTMIMGGTVPAGTLLLGSLASLIGLPLVYVIGGALGIAAGLWVWLSHPSVRTA
jgi:hypothetical protein